MNSPILSIVIPTFNRSHLLRVLLRAIERDFPIWPNDVELIIVDNASVDQTCDLALEFVERGIPLKLVRNDENIGMDRNLAACFGLATGKYFWQIGDDDIPFVGTVKHVLSICRSMEFGILHLDCTSFVDGNQEQILATRMPDEIEILTLNRIKAFRSINVFLTFISANVINRHAVLNGIPGFDYKSELNTWLPQLAWIFGALRTSDTHLHIPQPLFGALGGNTGGYRLVEVFGKNLAVITERLLADVVPNAKRIMSNAALTRVIASELWAMRKRELQGNKFARENLGEALRNVFGDALYFRCLVSPIVFSKNIFFARILFRFLYIFNIFNRKIGYVLL